MADHLDRSVDLLCKKLTEHAMGAALCASEIISIVEELHGDGRVSATRGGRRSEDAPVPSRRPLLDESRLSVWWKGQELILGHTHAYWLLARLTRSANQYVTHADLSQDVWDDEFTDTATLRAGVRRLRRKLRDGGMGDLAGAIVGHHGRYMLTLDGAGTSH